MPPSIKVMVAFSPTTYSLLENKAKDRGISIQELIRAVIIPDWAKLSEIAERREMSAGAYLSFIIETENKTSPLYQQPDKIRNYGGRR